jgi:hypothetical protein
MHFLQRSTQFSKTCCRPLITYKFLVSELHFHGWKSPEIAWGEIKIEFCFRLGKSRSVEPHQNIRHTVRISLHAISGLFEPWKASSEARNFEVINGLQHVLEKWVERCKKFIAYQGRYFEKRPSPHLHKVPTRSNTVSPRNFQTSLVIRKSLGIFQCCQGSICIVSFFKRISIYIWNLLLAYRKGIFLHSS